MYGDKGKGSVKNQCFDGTDYFNDMIMGFPSLGPSRSYGGGASSYAPPFDHQTVNGKSGVSGHFIPPPPSSSVLLNGYNEESLCDYLYNKMGIGNGLNESSIWMNGTVGGNNGNLNCNTGKNYGGSESFHALSHKQQMDHHHLLQQMRRKYQNGESELQNLCPIKNSSFCSPRFCADDDDDDDDDDDGVLGSRFQRLPWSFRPSADQGFHDGIDHSVLSSQMMNSASQWTKGLQNESVVGFKQNLSPQELALSLRCYANDNENFKCLKGEKMNDRLREEVLMTYNQEHENGASNRGGSFTSPPTPMQPVHINHNQFLDAHDYICKIAKNQLGCRILQRAFDQGTSQDVQLIFEGIIDHVVEFTVDQFGNYLVQKLLNFCNDDQRMQIVFKVTREPGLLLRISLDTHGTRVVQKLIETIKTRQQISLVTQALEPGFLDLATDLNGNHVLQRCLQSLSKEHNKFIMNAAARYCFEIATHRYGCCVLNKCLGYASGKHRDKLLASILFHALILAQDAFGNYVIQYIIELKDQSTASVLLSQFEGHFVHLSKQKFSSHVVEKCLKFIEESRSRIIHELVLVPQFEQLLQDPFANYVIQSALGVAKGTLRALLVDAVQPHLPLLRSNPFCKRILSQNILKKK